MGCLLSEAFDIRVRDRVVRGALSSWLSVDPAARTPGLAMRLLEALRQRHTDHGLQISIGVTSDDRGSAMRRFWDLVGHRRTEDTRFLAPVRFWTRVFDGRAVGEAAFDTFERIAVRVATHIPYGWVGWRTPAGVRPYEAGDLDRCLGWLRAQSAGADLALEWSPARLALQLGHPYVTTLVIDDGDRGGFVNYYAINYVGRRSLRVAVIDLCAGTIGVARQLDLLTAACRQMASGGVHMALMMVSAASPAQSLLAAGFVQLPGHSDLFTVFPDPSLPLHPPLRVHTLFT